MFLRGSKITGFVQAFMGAPESQPESLESEWIPGDLDPLGHVKKCHSALECAAAEIGDCTVFSFVLLILDTIHRPWCMTVLQLNTFSSHITHTRRQLPFIHTSYYCTGFCGLLTFFFSCPRKLLNGKLPISCNKLCALLTRCFVPYILAKLIAKHLNNLQA